MTEFAGLLAYGIVVYAALTYADYLAHRRRVADWAERAERLRHMKGTT